MAHDAMVVDYSRPLLLLDDLDEGLGHLLADLGGLLPLSLVEGLSDAEDDLEALVERGLGSVGDSLGRVGEQGSSLRVSGQGVLDPGVDEHGGGDLSGEGSLVGRVHVLGRDVDGRLGILEGREVGRGRDEEHGRRGDNNLCRMRQQVNREESQSVLV